METDVSTFDWVEFFRYMAISSSLVVGFIAIICAFAMKSDEKLSKNVSRIGLITLAFCIVLYFGPPSMFIFIVGAGTAALILWNIKRAFT